ncbi:MAG: hypothetical protein GY851_06110 [bacterium]|nr:hypothetical protein [bacterium]
MERLTEERGNRTWKLYHIGWYINLLAFLGAVACGFWFLWQVVSGGSGEETAQLTDITVMSGLFVIAAVLLLGAGISRYQARLEGQHLELKLAINKLAAAVEKTKSGAGE